MKRGAARHAERAAYITVGTGIGVGIKTGGSFAGRPLHPELGHIRVARHTEDRAFRGVCSFHGDCLEGLSAAPALIARCGTLEELDQDHQIWRIAGYYLAQLCLTLSLGFRLQKIVLGGGVSEATALLPAVQQSFADLSSGYLPEASRPEELIVRAGLGSDAGLFGAFEIARRGATSS
jgi:fructokinase